MPRTDFSAGHDTDLLAVTIKHFQGDTNEF
jgi:hypothetical protein